MAKPIHSMIRVLDEARSVDFYRRAFAMRVADRYDFEGFTLVYLAAEDSGFSFGITASENSLVLYLVSSLFMLPYCSSNIRCPTFSDVATSVSCSTTSSGEPMMT